MRSNGTVDVHPRPLVKVFALRLTYTWHTFEMHAEKHCLAARLACTPEKMWEQLHDHRDHRHGHNLTIIRI